MLLEIFQKTLLQFLQEQVKGIPITTEAAIQKHLEEQFPQNASLWICLGNPLPRKINPSLPGPVIESLSFTVQVRQEPFAKPHPQYSLLALAEKICQKLHLQTFTVLERVWTGVLAENQAWKSLYSQKNPLLQGVGLEFSAC